MNPTDLQVTQKELPTTKLQDLHAVQPTLHMQMSGSSQVVPLCICEVQEEPLI